MKRLMLIFIIVSLIVFSSSGFSADLKRLTYPNIYFADTLANAATDKVPVDTLFINFFGNYDRLGADTMLIYFRIDSLVGLYGHRAADSLGLNPVSISYQPVLDFARPSYVHFPAILDTVNVEAKSVIDSVTSKAHLKVYSMPIEYEQYYIYIKHNHTDTSVVNAQAKTAYKGVIGLKKKGRLSNLDLINSIKGNPDLNLNPTALGDVKLFGGADFLGAGVDGKRLKIHRNATGEVDSLEFYILANTKSYIKASGSLELEAAADVTFNSTYGTYVFEHQNSTGFIINTDLSADQTVLKVREASGNQIIIGGDGDFDHPLQEQPTFYVQGMKHPDSSNQYYGMFYHDSLGFVIGTGAGIGAGLTPTEIENYISFRPRGVEAMKIDSAGKITMDSSLTVARSVTGSEFINASKMFVGENPIDKLKQVIHKEGTEIGDWAEIDHEKLPEGVKVPIVKQFFKDRKNGEEVWKPDIYSHINTLLIPILPVSEDDSLGTFYREESTGMYYFSKKEYIDSKYELINKRAYGESLTGIVDIMRNAIIELKAENDLLKERIDKLEIQ